MRNLSADDIVMTLNQLIRREEHSGPEAAQREGHTGPQEAAKEELRGFMRVDCAWHPKLCGCEKVMREAAPGHEGDPVSHGLCPECLEIVWPKEKKVLALQNNPEGNSR